VRVSVQEEKAPESQAVNHLLVVTLEPVYDPAFQVLNGVSKTARRELGNLSIRARIPAPEQVNAVYAIPPIGYEMGKIDAVPRKVSFSVKSGEIEVVLPDPSDAEVLLIARDARPLIGVQSDSVSATDGRTTPLLVTVDNATGGRISGEILFPAGFRAESKGAGLRFNSLAPGERYSARFDVTAPSPIDRNRTFTPTVRYQRAGGASGEASSYPVTSRTDERLALGWLQRAEAEMTEVTTTPGVPRGSPYTEAMHKREFVYAAYNDGAYADTVRLAREILDLCKRMKEQRKQ